MIHNKQLGGWLFTAALFTALIIPLLSRDGMFFDGTLYASISRNMAEGTGSFWDPYYSATLGQHFYDAPPLALGLQSLFFRISGDHFWTERLYCLLMAMLCAALIIALWKRIPGIDKRAGWLPLMLWLAIPLVHWSYTNNVLENTMTVFCLLAVICLQKSVERNHHVWQAAAAAMLVCAFLTKGFTGLYPLAFYFIHWLVFRQYSFMRMMVNTFLLLLYTCIIIAPLFIISSSSHSLLSYLQVQVVRSIAGAREVDGHFFILKKLSMELIIPAAITLIAWLMLRAIKGSASALSKKCSLFFLLIALSGSLPVMISPKQSGFYVLAVLPFFALAAASIIYPLFTGTVKVHAFVPRIISVLCIIVTSVVITWSALHFGEARRDENILHDIRSMNGTVNEPVIGISESLRFDWSFHAYLMRYAHLSAEVSRDHKWYLSDAKEELPEAYSDSGLHLKVYRLCKAPR
jgi:4-amino-4-deoxy-L-arabinose transferase-like glycosyltransferase